MKRIVSISGGIGSYFTLKRVIEQYPTEVLPVFCDTLFEDGDLYRFLYDIESKFGIEIVRLCVGKTPFQVAYEENFLFNSRVALCSKRLKSEPFREWLNENYTSEQCVVYLGIDWTETHRTDAIIRNYQPYKVEFPMIQPPYISKYEMLEELEKEGIQVPRLYREGFSHNNCKGCCFKAGIGQYKNLLEKDRNLFLEWENCEETMRRKLKKDVSILKRKGRPFTLKHLRELMDTQPEQLSLFDDDIGGCGCFIDE